MTAQKALFRLDGRRALVTGAATGLGRAIAATLARQGADVVISDKPGESLDETARQVTGFRRRVFARDMDVRDLEQIARCVEQVKQACGDIDILINNAGINRPMRGLDVTEESWDDHFRTNIKGGFFLAQKVAPMMIQRGWGRIIWISSQSGLVGIPGQPVYCASKGAVIQIVRTLGVEWARHGITVNSVAPTFVETNLTRKRLQDPDFKTFVLNKIPAHKLAESDDVAAAVAFLASPEAGMVNCHTLCVNGGWTCW